MRTRSRVSRSKNQMRMYESRSSVEPNRLFGFRAPAATPRTRPMVRDRKLTEPVSFAERITLQNDGFGFVEWHRSVGVPTA